MRRVAIAGAVTVLLIGVTGFGTIRGLGQNAEHEQITRRAMGLNGLALVEPQTLNELAGQNGTWGAVGAPDNPARGLMSSEKNHCDGADWFNESGYPQSKAAAQAKLEACRTYIFDRLNDAVRDAGDLAAQNSAGKWVPRADQMPTADSTCTYLGQKGRAKCNVLEDMGLAFHAAQDFYSHSNWGDKADTGSSISRHNPPGLNNGVTAPWLDPNSPGTPFPDGLITGCYEGFPESTNCNYGFFKSRVKHDYLNKDGVGKDRSKINDNYNKAMNLAAQDSYRKWIWLETQIMATYPGARGSAILCGLKKDSATSC